MSYISSTALRTYQLFRSFQEGVDTQLKELVHSDEPDILYRAFVQEPQLGEQIIQNLESLIPENQKKNVHFALYGKHDSVSLWTLLGTVNHPEQNLDIHPDLINNLNQTIAEDSLYRPAVYFGQKGYRYFYIEMTHKRDTLSYVLEIRLKIEGFSKFFESEKNTLITFTSMILIFSILLGSLFAKSISKPINKLTDKALNLAKGDMGIRFKSKRLDDIGTLARSLDTMSLNLNHRFNSMQTMNKIDRAVLSSVSRNELLKKVAGFISEQFDNTTVAVLEYREEGLVIDALVPERAHSVGRLILQSNIPDEIKNISETVILDLEKIRTVLPGDELFFPRDVRKKKGVMIPILHNEKLVATFAITLDEVTDQDKEALEMLSDQVGVALRSKIEMEQREEITQGTLIALTRTVDAKSRWTAGHTDRVARLSVALAAEIGLSSKEINEVRISALLHDIGKLGIPEMILDKPGKLTDEEYDLIKRHPEKGDTIIKDIPGMEAVRMGVRHHHERWNGSGYPDGLQGKQIPWIARIITLSDIYDAISEDRPYRKSFTAKEVYDFLEAQRGLIFDPELLDSFFKVISDDVSPL